MTSNELLTLPDRRICLICNTRPKAGTDDLCDACSSRLLSRGATGYRPPYEDVGKPVDRHHRHFGLPVEFDASPGQENAIRHMEET